MLLSLLPLAVYVISDALTETRVAPATAALFHHESAVLIFIFIIIAPGCVSYLMVHFLDVYQKEPPKTTAREL